MAKELCWIDKSTWRKGPWMEEPDKAEWVDASTGLPCLIVRQDVSGHLCGYVGVPERSALAGKCCADVDVEVHGGLTYADYCVEEDKEHGVCHAAPERAYWFGFDCAHLNDLAFFTKRDPLMGTYRDVAYVRTEIEKLAKQLAGLMEESNG